MNTIETNDECAIRVRAAYMRNCRWYLLAIASPDSEFGRSFAPRWDGGTDEYGIRRVSVWRRIAKLLNEIECTAIERFVSVQFNPHPPSPEDLLTADAQEQYRALKDSNYLSRKLDTHCRTFKTDVWKMSTLYPECSAPDL